VDSVFLEESMALKRQYLTEHKADFLVMGDDWADKFDEFNDICRVIYLPRTAGISTTETIQKIRRYE
jgi:glycerol-3-phosphate cytidylyltransferase